MTLISSWIPFEDPQGGPNFYHFGDNVLYDFKIDNNGDGVEDITYQFRFTSQVREPQHVSLRHRADPRLDNPNRNMFPDATRSAGSRTAARYSTAGPMLTMYDNVGTGVGAGLRRPRQRHLRVPTDVGGTGQVFAGQTDDPFFLDLRVFDLLYGGEPQRSGR